ncbi:hypothetical protein LTSEINV_6545 [Salmonella enterica subsp. enterica serovar Inverness str. R8-3668]|uniref:Uncharacterized protein n=2 Tax=Salmonella enterica I TaxID=59201 RepID=G5S0P6_SALET|nr:hypothetical protein LTSEINV_6545 [Salmonella enterica subsp. enterica serovar Inverness str. R8-3668]EHC99657.1 hypothetical protein LTSEURB_4751 [Salmonella enterica subsp. enterica serovar Urbana str. R8-2977]
MYLILYYLCSTLSDFLAVFVLKNISLCVFLYLIILSDIISD